MVFIGFKNLAKIFQGQRNDFDLGRLVPFFQICIKLKMPWHSLKAIHARELSLVMVRNSSEETPHGPGVAERSHFRVTAKLPKN